MSREAAFLVFFCLFSVVYTHAGSSSLRASQNRRRSKSERETPWSCATQKNYSLSLSLSLSLSRVSRSSTAEVCRAFVVRMSSSPFSTRSSRREECVLFYVSKRFEKRLRNTHNFFRPPHVACEKFFPKERLWWEFFFSLRHLLWVSSQISPPRDLKRRANAEREKNGCWIIIGRARLSRVFIQRLIYEFASFERERGYFFESTYIYI